MKQFLLMLMFSALASTAVAQTGPAISILQKEGNPKIGPQAPPAYVGVLDEMGLRVNFPGEKSLEPLTWDRLKQFNMLVLTTSPNFNTGHQPTGHNVHELLDRYLQEGGGILYIGQEPMASHKEHDDINAWLKKYGAQFEWATVEDEAHSYKDPPPVPWQRSPYQWTSNIAKSPITEGVNTLFFLNWLFYSPVIRPLQLTDDAWQVLVRTEPTAQKWQLVRPGGGDIANKIPGTAETGAHPLLAVRQAGKGRLAVFGADPAAFWYDLGKPVQAQVASVRGDGKRTSDWLPLLRNLATWLSEPARTAGFPGGETKRVQFFVNPEYGSREPIDWQRPDISVPDSEIHRLFAMHSSLWKVDDWRAMAAGKYSSFNFLVGAQSMRGGGSGTVAQWKAAAQRAGYNGVIFREKILEMSREEWEAFEAECTAASHENFLALPGQEFEDWEGNRFMRFAQHIPYPKAERLTEDKKRVKHQLHFFFDAGWPANFPLSVKGNPTAYWNYRVYSALPVMVYQGGKVLEDNRAEWRSLVERHEYPTPLAVHLLQSPSEVAATTEKVQTRVLAPSLTDLRDNTRWKNNMGTGVHNSLAWYTSGGPEIEAFLPLNMYRATLGSRDLPSTYRYQVLIRARSPVPISEIELWGGDRLLRRYRPNKSQVTLTIDELHDEQKNLWLRVRDVQGREALADGLLVHDKMFVFYWVGDHANMIPYGQGVDTEGNPTGLGIATHVKSMYQPSSGPGATFTEWQMFVPHGTDTSAPTLGIKGDLSFNGQQGVLPAPTVHYIPDLRFWHASRDALITRMSVDRYADRNKYTDEVFGHSYISGWGSYVRTTPTEYFDIVTDDVDFQRDAGQPGLQLTRGEVRFKRDVTLSSDGVLNLTLGRLQFGAAKQGLINASGKVAQPGSMKGKLGRGNFVTFPGDWGHGTIYALDENFVVDATVNEKGEVQLAFGYALGNRTFKAGEVLPFRLLIMRWPVGTAVDSKLDARVRDALNLTHSDSGFNVNLRQGKVLDSQFTLDLQAQNNAVVGQLVTADSLMRVPVRVTGLNDNWSAGVWDGKQFLPIAGDPTGFAWTILEQKQGSTFFLGNALTCENPGVILRLLPRTSGGYDVIAHNPLDKKISVTVRGMAGGPVAGLQRRLKLAPGEEVRFSHE